MCALVNAWDIFSQPIKMVGFNQLYERPSCSQTCPKETLWPKGLFEQSKIWIKKTKQIRSNIVDIYRLVEVVSLIMAFVLLISSFSPADSLGVLTAIAKIFSFGEVALNVESNMARKVPFDAYELAIRVDISDAGQPMFRVVKASKDFSCCACPKLPSIAAMYVTFMPRYHEFEKIMDEELEKAIKIGMRGAFEYGRVINPTVPPDTQPFNIPPAPANRGGAQRHAKEGGVHEPLNPWEEGGDRR